MKQFEALLEESVGKFREGSIVKGKVIEKRGSEVLIDIGYKSEGAVDVDEFDEELVVGEDVEVLLERLENDEGMVVLSRQKAAQKQYWDKILKTFEEGKTISGKVKKVVKGGLMVNIGVEAFLPASQIDVVAPKNLREYEGNTYDFKIVKISEERKNVVLSRRELVEEERSQRRTEMMKNVKKGDLVKGAVKNITDFGVFIDLSGLDGLLHITDISWGRINHPSEVFAVGQEVEVLITDIDMEKERVSLGYKQRFSNPWEKIAEKYAAGMTVKGKVTNIVAYGAFVELEPNVEGLVHISELSWTRRVARVSDVLTVGQEVEAQITEVDKDAQKLSLSLRRLQENPWDKIHERYPEGKSIKGQVRSITSFGAFMEVEEGIDGMIHVSDISWTRKINHPSEVLKKGQDVEAVVIGIDRENQRISLGLKQLAQDPWKEIDSHYKVGDLVKGKIAKIANFGAFVELADEIDGLVHISQISEDRVEKVKDVLKVGDEVNARVIKVDKTERRIGLSIKAANYTEEQLEKERAAYENIRTGDMLSSMGDAFDKLEFRPGESKKD